MQTTKNQHYVPRFYMKPFSIIKNEGKKEKALISFYQFEGDLCKDNIPTTSICSKKFFYDKDGRIENRLAEKENKWRSTIFKINRGEVLTKCDTENIREFTAFQISRTKAMLAHTRDMAAAMLTHMQNGHLSETVIKEKVETKITSEFNLNFVKDILFTIDDLKMVILENKTDVDFFTSDAPVIIINPLGGFHGIGLGEIGAVIFFPVSPRKVVMFYDSKLYGKITEEIQDSEYISIFNKYQYISADERILSSDSIKFKEFVQDEKLNNFRKEFHVSVKPTAIDDGSGILIAAKSRGISYYFDIPIFKLPKSLKKIPRDFRDTFPRKYNLKSRKALLYRIYSERDFKGEEKTKNYWKQVQRYAKISLQYFDYYWKTPKQDRIISGELMRQLKEARVNFFSQKN